MPDRLLGVLSSISRFIASGGIDWLNFKGVNLDMEISLLSGGNTFHTCSGNDYENLRELIGWAMSSSKIGVVTLELKGLEQGKYRMEIWHISEGYDSQPAEFLDFEFPLRTNIGLDIDHGSFAYKIYKVE